MKQGNEYAIMNGKGASNYCEKVQKERTIRGDCSEEAPGGAEESPDIMQGCVE
ncbi:MAG: hypothetical protein LUH20_05005 [Lachnospiraceae bacterium]|nr:hypothetical protein [Lachnospiraceae bacterium]